MPALRLVCIIESAALRNTINISMSICITTQMDIKVDNTGYLHLSCHLVSEHTRFQK
ncbi:hypothetical protein D3C73_921880 [compost metagenome]